MATEKPQVMKELPPFREELQVIKLVKDGAFPELKPLDFIQDINNAPGDFNDLSPVSGDFNDLASLSGSRFFALAHC
jgi:hypothetical protein